MLSITAMNSGQGNYYLAPGNKDYYILGGESRRWMRSVVKELVRQGILTEAASRNVLGGMTPDESRPLVQNAGKRRSARRKLPFSAPRSVSVVWVIGSHDARSRIERGHRARIAAALSAARQKHRAFRRQVRRG